MNVNQYYVYLFLDARKPGKYEYGKYSFDHEPFYVGKGVGKRIKQHYNPGELSRKNLKNSKIKSILNIGLKPIELYIHENLTETEACKIECELILLIGRLELKTGPLTNMTDGGDGVSGYIATDELKLKRSINSQGSKNPFYGKKHILGSMDFMNRKVYQIDINTDEIIKEFPSISNAAKETGSNENHIGECCRGKRKTNNGFKWKYADDNIANRNWNSGRKSKENGGKVKILQLDFETDEVIKEWDSISDAARFFKIRRQNIIKALTGWVKSSAGFKWKYKD